MHADDAVIDEGAYGEVFEAFGEGLPEPDAVTTLAFVVEAVDFVDVVCFVVSAQKEEVVGIFYFIGEEEANALDTLLASVHVITTSQARQGTNPRNR